MLKIAFIFSLIVCSLTATVGQTAADTITMKKVFGGYEFSQHGQILKMNELLKILQPNEAAFKQMQAAQTTNAFATVIGFVGGFMIGFPIGTAIAGGEPNWAMAGIGAGLLVVTIPITKRFNTQSKQAIESYNSGLQTTSFWNNTQVKLCISGNGAGLHVNF